jgi:DNA (cytosine-5)-methyltransferase 1
VAGRLTCIDAFSGPGGLSLGLRRAGFDVRAAFDSDAKSIETYRRNHGKHGFQADARTLTAEELIDRARLGGADLDLFAGGPPCQGFSKQKRGAHMGDERNALVLEFLRLAREIHPRSIMLENVPMMAQKRGRHLVEDIERQLDDYRVTSHFYIAADYGVAQTRQRFVMVAVRDDVPGDFCVPDPTTPRPVWTTVEDVIRDMPEPPEDYSDHPDFPNHQRARVTEANIERFSYVPQGGGWKDIPFEKRLLCHQDVDTTRGGWPEVFGRLEWGGQCPTITGGFDSFTRGRYGHPQFDRPLTPREAARLQGFPDRFVFLGTRHDIRHQIGNAVPIPLAEAVGRAVRLALEGTTHRPPEPEELFLFDPWVGKELRKVGAE